MDDNKELGIAITKGSIGDSLRTLASIHGLNGGDIIKILEEIIQIIKK